MLMKSGFFLFLLTVLQVSALYKNVVADFIENVISSESAAVSSSASRIVSGWEAQPGQIPHHAALRMVNPNGVIRQCGGSIVSKEWVFTSAFCTVGRTVAVVRAGVVSLLSPEYVFETTEWYHHPLYDESRPNAIQANDLSLVKLQRPVVFTRLLKPIRVQSSADAYRNYDGEQVYVSGHGYTWTSPVSYSDVLRWVYLRAISNVSCRNTYSSASITDTKICATFFNVTSQSTCSGDLGGPLVHVGLDGVPTLVGVASFFYSGGCHLGRPAGFTRPGPFLPWIKEVTGIDFDSLQGDTTTTSTTATPTTTTITDSSITTPSDSTTTPFDSTTTPFDSTTTPSDSTTTPSDSTTTPSGSSTTTFGPTTTSSDSTSTSSDSTSTTIFDPTTTDSSTITTSELTTSTPPEENTAAPPEDSEESEEDSEYNLLKRLVVYVKVKVGINKYNMTKEVGKEITVSRH